VSGQGVTAVRAPIEARLFRRAAVEAVGTGILVMIVVVSGIQATRLTTDVGLQLLANSTTTVLVLAVLIAVLAPISGAHLNPRHPGRLVARPARGVVGRRFPRAGDVGPPIRRPADSTDPEASPSWSSAERIPVP
jgi:hypothetical protein